MADPPPRTAHGKALEEAARALTSSGGRGGLAGSATTSFHPAATGSLAATEAPDTADMRGQISGGGGAAKRPKRTRRGKVTNVGGHRVVNYYELTKHELDSLGSKRAEAARSTAIAAFFLGLVADGAKDALLNPPSSQLSIGVWVTLLAVAVMATLYYAQEAWQRDKAAKTFLHEVKEEHDFEA